MEETKNLFGQILKELRTERGLTQVEVARAIGVAQGTIYFWENSINEPTAAYLIKLAQYFNVSVDELLGVDNRERELSDKERILQMYKQMSPKQKRFALKLMSLVADDKDE